MNEWSRSRNLNILLYAILMVLFLITGYAIILYSGKLVIGVIALLTVLFLSFLLKPEFLLGAVLLGVMGGSTYYWASEFYYIRFLFLGAFLGKGLVDLATKRLEIKSLPYSFILPLSIFSIFSLFSTFYSVSPGITFQRALTWILLLFALGIYLWNYADSYEKLRRMVVITVGVVLFATILSLLVWIMGAPVFLGQRFRGIFINPNTIGSLFVLIALPLFWLYQKANKNKGIYGITIIFLLGLVLFTGSRGSILAVFLSFFLYFFLVNRKKFLGLSIIGIPLIGLYLINPNLSFPGKGFFVDRIIRPGSAAIGSGRLVAWEATMNLIQKRPWFGYGFGSAETVFPLFIGPEVTRVFQGANPHSSYLDILLESGLFGLILVLLPIGLVIGKGFKLSQKYREKWFIAMLLATVIAATVHGFFEAWMTSVGSVSAIPFWLYVMIIFKYDELRKFEGQED